MIDPEIPLTIPQPIPYIDTSKEPSEFSRLLSGVILPCFSANFYLQAAKRKVSRAIWFFIFFGILTGTLATLGMLVNLLQVNSSIRDSYAQGTWPEITIQDGIASVDAPQPAVLFNKSGTVVIVDTTGTITHLDTTRYTTGLLLTRTYLEFLNSGGQDQRIPLAQLNSSLSTNPILINGETVTRLWSQFSVIIAVVYWFGAIFWNGLMRLGYSALLALLVWVIFRLFQPRSAYTPVFVVGVYAFIPALYVSILFEAVQVKFFAMQTLVWLVIWLAALILAVRRSHIDPDLHKIALWSWRTWIGVPMLAAFALNAVFSFADRAIILWGITIATLMTLIIVDLVKTLRAEPTPAG
jgi:hypothetical protein